jgi:hypothetical protein
MTKKALWAAGTPALCLFLAVACLVVLSCAAAAQADQNSFRFVVMGDSPQKCLPTDPVEKCIDTAILNQINQDIISLNPKPAFVIFSGDLAEYGGTAMLQGWNNVMQTVSGAGIAVYPIIGNHEITEIVNGAESFSPQLQQDFQAVYSNLPQNGPQGYNSLAYSFTYGNSFFLIYDTFYLDPSATSWTDDPNIQPAQFSWADTQTATANANPALVHKFAFSHAPAFTNGNTPTPCPYAQYSTDLWTRLDNNGFDAYIAAHEHYYARFKVKASTEPPAPPSIPWHNNVFEVISGGAGAPLVEAPGCTADVTQVQYHYTVVDVQGGTVSFNAYTYDNPATPFDSFTVSRQALAVKTVGTGGGTVQSDQPFNYVDCGTLCTAYFNQGAVVTLTAAPDANSVFTGWAGACSGVLPCVVKMNGNVTVSAVFTAKPLLSVHKLSFGDDDGTVVGTPLPMLGSGAQTGINCGVNCSGQYAVGTSVRLMATASPGSTFAGWSGPCTGAGKYCTVLMNESRDVIATFGSPPE